MWIAGMARPTPAATADPPDVKLLANAAGANKPHSLPTNILQQLIN
jgi:hypothetical protein